MERTVTEVLERLSVDAEWLLGEFERYRKMAAEATEMPEVFASKWMMREMALGVEGPLSALGAIAAAAQPAEE